MKLLIYLIIGTVMQLVYRLKYNTDEWVDSVKKSLEGIDTDPEDEQFRRKMSYSAVYGIWSVILNILLWPVNIIVYLVACIIDLIRRA